MSASRRYPASLEFVDRQRTVPLRQLLAVRAVDMPGSARIAGPGRRARRRMWICLGVLEMWSGPAQDMGDPVEPVLDRRCEVVGRPSIRADRDQVLELLVRVLDPAADEVVPRGHALVGHADADRALVLVCLALRYQARAPPPGSAPSGRAGRSRRRPSPCRASGASAGSARSTPPPRGSCRCSRSAAGTRRPRGARRAS